MLSKQRLFSCAAVLLVLLMLLPAVYNADATEDQKAKIAPKLAVQLSAARPDEIVSAVVRMRARPQIQMFRGDQLAVVRELRRVTTESQDGLARYLNKVDVKPRVKTVRRFWLDNLVLVRATPDVIAEISARPDVQEVFENFTITLPERPEGSERPNIGQSQTQLWDSITKIGAKQVWSAYGLDGSGVVVGGLDTGVEISHADISGKMKTTSPGDPTYPGGWAEFDSNGNIIAGSVPHDTDGHGTHTTGTMIGGNASGYDIGVAPGATLMHGLVLPGGSGYFTQVIGGMEWIIDPDGDPTTDDGARVVNMSLGGSGTSSQMIAPVDNMIAMNVFPAMSIGNSGPGSGTTGSPGNVPSAFGVGATDSTDVIASFSSRGPVTWNTPPYVGTYIKPDISAPGVKIYSSVPGGDWQWHGAGWDWSGTSMAAPHVAGTAALMYQADPALAVEIAKDLIAQTALELGDPGKDNTYGWGRVNAYGAVTAALSGVGTLQGTVYSSGGGTVENAKVLLVDTGQRVYTDEFGAYTLQTVAGDHSVEISRFGYDTFTTTVTVVADDVTTLDVTLTQLPSGTVAGFVTDGETAAGIGAAITVKLGGEAVVWTATDPATGEYGVTLPVGTYELVFSPVFPYPLTTRPGIEVLESATTTMDVALDAAQVLVVDDDGGQAFEAYYEAAIAAAGRSYLTVTAPPTAADMALFESVVWLTGNDWSTTLEAADQAALADYLDGGGRLFVSGQDVGYDIKDSGFYTDYLHAVYVQDDVGLGAVLGAAASPIGSGLAFEITGGSGANNQGYPSEIDVLSPAQTALVYDEAVPMGAVTGNTLEKGIVQANGVTSSGTAGLTVDTGTYKLVYFAFGFEAIADMADRAEVMGRVLDWLLGYPDIAHTPLGDTEETASPYHVRALITSGYFTLDPATFALVYDAGAGDVTVPLAATGVPDEYEAYIPAQPIGTEVYYYLTAADVEGHASYDPAGAPPMRHMFNVGWDEEAPVIVHSRYYNTNDLDGPYTICAEVTDNTGIESVYLMYAKNGGMYHRVEMIPGMDGLYCVAIPGPSEVGDYYEYCIYAMDESYHGNVTRMPAEGHYRFEIVEYFSWDFEFDDGGFVPAGGVWEWGEPTTGPGDAHSGVNVWATILGGTYPNNADATLDIPPITLAASKPYALLSMWHWYYMETNYDGGNVKVSTDGGMTWTVVEPIGGYDGTARSGNAGIPGEDCFTGYNNDFWQMELFDFSAFAGQQVTIRFHFGSDGSVYKTGWYVDDLMLRSSDVDDFPPAISGTEVPSSTFDTAGPYEVTTYVMDPLSDVASVSLLYSTDDGATFNEVAMGAGTGDEYVGYIPGQPNGTRIEFYIKAVDTSSEANESFDPPTAPAETHEFAILPSAPILVMQGTSTSTSLEMFREALEANGHEADYWYNPSQGWLSIDKLELYKTIIYDESYGLTSTEQADLAAYLEGGTQGVKRHLLIMGRDLAYNYSTRPWIDEYMRAQYVQDNPGYRELTGYPGEYIGAGETFVISGSYPDEIQRSATYPGGEIVYQYTGPGTAFYTRDELAGEYEKAGKEWDGVVPNDPNSIDAAAGMKYNGETYRSVYFSFNFYYIQETARRTGIIARVIGWLSAPDIVHVPLHDTEDTLNAYTVMAEVYSEDLDPSRVNLVYDVGAGPVTITMASTGAPDEYAADIPPQSFGTTVNYYLGATNYDGNTSYNPSGAPGVQHTFEVTSDITPPEIVHAPLSPTTDQTGPYAVEATITDNVGVDPAGVFLTYNKNSGANATVGMTNAGGDLYRGEIPGPAVLGDVFNYYIRARDVAAVPNYAREPAAGYHSFGIVDYFAWDFEADGGGFAATGPDWEWGEPTTGPSDAYSGVNVWATKLGDNYSYSSDSRLETPGITVPATATYASLSFWQWFYIETSWNPESAWDGGNVKISTDGGSSWTIIYPDIGYNGTASSGNAGIPGEPCFTGYDNDYWHKATFDLTPYKGQSVIIMWHFGSDGSVNKVGWYVDDVRIEGMEDTEGPAFVSTDVPGTTFDEVGPYTVTTVVNDALSGVSTATLYYSVDDGASWTPVTMAPTANPDEYGGDIPGQSSGTRIKLYVEAEDGNANTSTDPAGAPAVAYEFGIMPSGDYLVLLGGGSHTTAEDYQLAFSTIGETADIWDWDDLGLPTLAILQSYTGLVVDEGWYLDSGQMTLLSSYLDADVGAMNRIFFLGRDLSYGSTARSFMEQYTGSAYVQDSPSWYELTSTPGDPIGNDETFVIQGSYPDELKLSTSYTGGSVIYKYTGTGSSLDRFGTEEELIEFYQKEGKDWDPKLSAMAPSGPDSAAAVRYVGPFHSSVYFAFNLDYIQEDWRRAGVLGRALAWLSTASRVIGKDVARGSRLDTPEIPDRLVLWQNYPNPFNPVTKIQFGIPKNVTGPVQLRIYNVKGELVRTVFEGTKEPGVHTFLWDGTNVSGHNVSSGIYFCRFVAGDVRMVRKMVLLR